MIKPINEQHPIFSNTAYQKDIVPFNLIEVIKSSAKLMVSDERSFVFCSIQFPGVPAWERLYLFTFKNRRLQIFEISENLNLSMSDPTSSTTLKISVTINFLSKSTLYTISHSPRVLRNCTAPPPRSIGQNVFARKRVHAIYRCSNVAVNKTKKPAKLVNAIVSSFAGF